MEKKYSCFIISPIKDEPDHYSNIFYYDIINNALPQTFDLIRADEVRKESESIWEDIKKYLKESDLVIAELTDLNPNVLYELGFRRSIGKPIIQFSQEIDNLPFDLKFLRTIKYCLTDRGIIKAKSDLKRAIEKIEFCFDREETSSNFHSLPHEKYPGLQIKSLEEIGEIEKLADEIWICTTDLESDVICTVIQDSVMANLSSDNKKKYIYFLDNNIKKENIDAFKHRYKSFSEQIELYRLPVDIPEIFEEVALYHSDGCKRTEAYTKVTYGFDRCKESAYIRLNRDKTILLKKALLKNVTEEDVLRWK